MKNKLTKFYNNLNRLIVYDNDQLKGISHYEIALVRMSLFYLHDWLFTYSLKQRKDFRIFTKYYYMYICRRIMSKEILTEQAMFFGSSDSNKNKELILKELQRQKRSINLLLDIYKSEGDDAILKGLIKRYFLI
jgi:hypothetical protein